MESIKQFGVYFGQGTQIYSLSNCVIRKETEKAFLVSGNRHKDSHIKGSVDFWVPKSQIIDFNQLSMVLPLWLKSKVLN